MAAIYDLQDNERQIAESVAGIIEKVMDGVTAEEVVSILAEIPTLWSSIREELADDKKELILSAERIGAAVAVLLTNTLIKEEPL